MKLFGMVRTALVVMMVPIMLGACAQTYGPAKLDGDVLPHWQASYDEIKAMNPKWGFQDVKPFKTSLDAGVKIVFVDVRTPAEWAKGVIPNAILVDLSDLPKAEGIAKLPADANAIIGVYCKGGHRSALALPLIHQLGYKNAISMTGGYPAWVKAGYPTAAGPAPAK